MMTTIYSRPDFVLKVNKSKFSSPSDWSIYKFIREQYKDGKLTDTSTYEFYIPDNCVDNLIKAMKND